MLALHFPASHMLLDTHAHTRTCTLLLCPSALRQRADNAAGQRKTSYCMAKEARSKSKGWREEEEGGRVGANFGCMACGVQITIFSAALRRRHHSICSITICCRETEREEEEEGDGGG